MTVRVRVSARRCASSAAVHMRVDELLRLRFGLPASPTLSSALTATTPPPWVRGRGRGRVRVGVRVKVRVRVRVKFRLRLRLRLSVPAQASAPRGAPTSLRGLVRVRVRVRG